ncbi:hypothetical protein B0H13DRAFT_1906647 [Mycena leptocephala]|nr:hypothetical protein B0H13DRAFT_1906647 [Mycena leptocephala]
MDFPSSAERSLISRIYRPPTSWDQPTINNRKPVPNRRPDGCTYFRLALWSSERESDPRPDEFLALQTGELVLRMPPGLAGYKLDLLAVGNPAFREWRANGNDLSIQRKVNIFAPSLWDGKTGSILSCLKAINDQEQIQYARDRRAVLNSGNYCNAGQSDHQSAIVLACQPFTAFRCPGGGWVQSVPSSPRVNSGYSVTPASYTVHSGSL